MRLVKEQNLRDNIYRLVNPNCFVPGGKLAEISTNRSCIYLNNKEVSLKTKRYPRLFDSCVWNPFPQRSTANVDKRMESSGCPLLDIHSLNDSLTQKNNLFNCYTKTSDQENGMALIY